MNLGWGQVNMTKFITFYRKHPNMSINDALDSLGVEKTFYNRFTYSRAEVVYNFTNNEDRRNQILQKTLSYASISLFILLPIFTIFLRLLYIRRKFTYVSHLIFVFHSQTVFFLLLTIYLIINFFVEDAKSILFLGLFLIYLFIAMKRFYNQGYIKTFIKYCLLNIVFIIVASIGAVFVGTISFLLA